MRSRRADSRTQRGGRGRPGPGLALGLPALVASALFLALPAGLAADQKPSLKQEESGERTRAAAPAAPRAEGGEKAPRTRHRRHIRHGYPYHRVHGGYYGFRYGYPRGYYGYGYYYRPGYFAPVWSSTNYRRAGLGALDMDVRPEKAEVYIDGTLVGVADNYDGFPSYLWLEKGTYDLVVYHEGFQTLARQVTIYPGLVIDVDNHLEPGEAVRPEDLVSKETKNRDERHRRNRERAEAVERRRAPGREYEPRPEVEEEREAEGVSRLILVATPGDAAVYLDGHFLGTAREIGGLSMGLLIEPGEHTIEVVHPRYGSERVRIEVEAGEDGRIEVDLERR